MAELSTIPSKPMKKLNVLALLALPMLAPSAYAAPTQKQRAPVAKWRASFPAALAEAQKTGKPLFVDFYTTWCSPCGVLETTVFQDPKFVAASQKWVLVKVDAEKNTANVNLAAKLGAVKFPVLLFLNSQGKQKARLTGFYPDSIVPALQKFARSNRKK